MQHLGTYPQVSAPRHALVRLRSFGLLRTQVHVCTTMSPEAKLLSLVRICKEDLYTPVSSRAA